MARFGMNIAVLLVGLMATPAFADPPATAIREDESYDADPWADEEGLIDLDYANQMLDVLRSQREGDEARREAEEYNRRLQDDVRDDVLDDMTLDQLAEFDVSQCDRLEKPSDQPTVLCFKLGYRATNGTGNLCDPVTTLNDLLYMFCEWGRN